MCVCPEIFLRNMLEVEGNPRRCEIILKLFGHEAFV